MQNRCFIVKLFKIENYILQQMKINLLVTRNKRNTKIFLFIL